MSDFEAIYYYLARDDEAFADLFRETLLEKTKLLIRFPFLGRKSHYSSDPNDREIYLFSYRIVYSYERETITILTIFHTRRKF